MKRGNIWRSRVAELTVNLIGEKDTGHIFHQIPELDHLFHCVEIACGIVRIADQDAFGPGGDKFSNSSTDGRANPSSMLEGTVTILAPADIAKAI